MFRVDFRLNLTRHVLIFTLILVTAGCAGKAVPPVFYPAEPDAPRYQYLKTIISEADLKSSALSKALTEGTFAFQKAFDVAAYKNTLIVTDSRLRGYAVINFDTGKINFIMNDSSNGRSQFAAPFGLAVDAEGTRYIADRRASRVLIYDKNDHYLRSIDFKPENSSPVDVAIDGNKLYVAHLKQNRIDVVDLNDDTVSKMETGDTNFEWPAALDFQNDHLYVLNLLQYNIIKLSTAGEKVATYGDLGDGTGKLARPKGVAVDRENRVLVLDASFGNFQIFREDQQLLGFVSKGGANPEDLSLPAGIAISYELAPFFQKYAAPGFTLEYVVAVSNQAGPSKVNIYGYGKMEGLSYPK